jgi:hypothetical protein
MLIIKTNLLVLYWEMNAAYCENGMKHINIMRGKNAEFLSATVQGTHI